MTAKTEAGALALEAQRGVEHRAAIWREGFAAGLEAAVDLAESARARSVTAVERAGLYALAADISAIPIPEAPTDEH